MPISQSRAVSLLTFLVPLMAAASARAAAAPDFQRDVQPILAEHCAKCHGIDADNRKSGLRLDVREDALKGGESGTAAILPGEPEKSELIERITSTDPGVVMPPPGEKKPL